MYAPLPSRCVPYPSLIRWCARASAAIVMTAWLGLVLVEAARPAVGQLTLDAFYQAAALAFVFGGYVLGWRKELAGGVLAIFGTVAFFAVHVLTFEVLPGLGAALFAAPGILYVLAWKYNQERQGVIAQA